MFITPAYAQGAAAAGGGTDMLIQLAPFLLIFVVMYFLILRPQQKRAKAHQEMVNSLRRGDVVVTTGGPGRQGGPRCGRDRGRAADR